MIKVSVDSKPLSVNRVWQGRRFKTEEYHDYEELMLLLLPKKKKVTGPVHLSYRFFMSAFGRSDVDNLLKPLTDILVKKGYIEDDRMVYKISAEKIKSEEDRIEIEIVPYQ